MMARVIRLPPDFHNRFMDVYQMSVSVIDMYRSGLSIEVLYIFEILPIFLIRSLVNNFRGVKSCFQKAVDSRRALSRMDAFPNPKAEDLVEDNICAVCRDEIKTTESAKKLFCRHIIGSEDILILTIINRSEELLPEGSGQSTSTFSNGRLPEPKGTPKSPPVFLTKASEQTCPTCRSDVIHMRQPDHQIPDNGPQEVQP
ncbi:unnamed protein product [Medioppia subpectinata]|uniref:Uncharacterized protein n=1 Tax=Medioppia subpectinata TaxID=1979941 RepID=A0A7R9KCX4_9ACAR|nr:unnamed protein product [Medioppia subpectinata]CAG2100916.1 unnamed protein product [Medioppia subpectinata]